MGALQAFHLESLSRKSVEIYGFVKARLRCNAKQYSDAEMAQTAPEEDAGSTTKPPSTQSQLVIGLESVDTSQSQRAITHMLQTYYGPLEAWYLRTSIEKVRTRLVDPSTRDDNLRRLLLLPQAHKMDTPDLSERPHVSSVVDDVFYLIKLVFNRGLTSGSITTLRSVMETVGRVVERDYLGVLQKKMDAVYSGGGAAIGLIGTNLPGASKEAEREKREKDLRVSFGVSRRCFSDHLEHESLIISCHVGVPE